MSEITASSAALRGRKLRNALFSLALGVGAAVLTASSCNDNLGFGQPGPVTFRVSVGPNDLQANGASSASAYGACSTDGNLVAFQSKANNIAVPGTGFTEIFIRDRKTGVAGNVSRLDLRLTSTSQFSDCVTPAISPDGRYVAWMSKAVLAGTEVSPQATLQLFLFDRQNPFTPLARATVAGNWPDHDITFLSVAVDSLARPLVCFESGSGNLGFVNGGNVNQIYVADFSVSPATITLVSHANGAPGTICNSFSRYGNISADGSTVAFTSFASNLVAPAPPAGEQIYVMTLATGVVELVSRASGAAGAAATLGSTLPTLSLDGRFVAFFTLATNITTALPSATGGLAVRDRVGTGAGPVTTLLAPDYYSFNAGGVTFPDSCSISNDGRFVTYRSVTDNQIYLIDSTLATRTLISKSNIGIMENNPQFFEVPFISGDGRWVFWNSSADNLVPGDSNGVEDIFGYGPIQ